MKAVDGVDLEVGSREIVAIVGESGSGKSVTALSIMRLIAEPGRILEGRVLHRGRDLLALRERDMQAVRGNSISMVFQNPHSALHPMIRIGRQLVETVALRGGLSPERARGESIALLERIGVAEAEAVLDRYPHEVSAGISQRAVLAMALAPHPALLIADEPTTNLDALAQKQFLLTVKRMRDEMDMSVLIITHDFGVVSMMADRVVVMYAGKQMESGTAAEVLRAPRHPYTSALLDSVRVLGRGKARRLEQIPGEVPDVMRLPRGCSFRPRCAQAIEACFEPPPNARADSGRTGPLLAPPGALSPWPMRRPSSRSGTSARRSVRRAAGDRPRLDGVSFTIARGEAFGLAGMSGAGKSTLGRIVMNLIPSSSGDVLFEGRSIASLDAAGRKDLWRRMQMVFQNPLVSMNPRRTARSILEMPLRSFGMGNAAERRERAYELLELVGLSTRHAEYYPHEFSGGQCQRLGIARAIASNPSFIFLDEPVSALDVSIQAQILNLLKELQEELHLTYLVVANNLNIARFVSDRLAIMEAAGSWRCARPRHLRRPRARLHQGAAGRHPLARRLRGGRGETGRERKMTYRDPAHAFAFKPGIDVDRLNRPIAHQYSSAHKTFVARLREQAGA